MTWLEILSCPFALCMLKALTNEIAVLNLLLINCFVNHNGFLGMFIVHTRYAPNTQINRIDKRNVVHKSLNLCLHICFFISMY